MDYRTVRGILFAEPKPGAPPPLATTTGTPARRLRDAIEPLACQSIWSEEAAKRYVELGLDDWFAAYIWERTAALGTPPTALAVMAMGVWNAELIGPLFDKAVAAISRKDIVATRLIAPGATVRRLLGDIDAEAAPVVDVLRRGIEAADAMARPLFAGLTGEPWPQDVAAQLVHACHLLREHRGDSHLAVCALAGLDPVEMKHPHRPVLQLRAVDLHGDPRVDPGADDRGAGAAAGTWFGMGIQSQRGGVAVPPSPGGSDRRDAAVDHRRPGLASGQPHRAVGRVVECADSHRWCSARSRQTRRWIASIIVRGQLAPLPPTIARPPRSRTAFAFCSGENLVPGITPHPHESESLRNPGRIRPGNG